jgi:hypothetical protein
MAIATCLGGHAVHAQDLDAAKASVVKIVAKTDEGKRKMGTGFVVRVEPDLAYIATASHVVEGDSAPQVEFLARRNRPVAASIVKREAGDERGIALIAVRGKENIPEGLQALPFASTEELKGGQEVIAIGFGQGQGDWAVIRANVASIDGRDIRLDGRIEEGNSGGPILKSGQVVGLITRTEGFGHATPAPFVELILRGWGLTLSRSDTPVVQPPRSAPARRSEAVDSVQRYGLRFAGATQGRTTLETMRLELRDGTLTLDGVQQPGPVDIVFNQSTETQILRVSDGEPTRVRKQFLAKSMKVTRGTGAQRQESEEPSPLQGKTVIGESSGGQWSYSSPDGALSPADRQELGSSFAADDAAFLPDPVPVGHEWEVSGADLHALLGLDNTTLGDGSATMRLRRIVSCGSEQCAEVEIRLRVAGLMVMDDGTQTGVMLEGEGLLLRSLKERIDVEANLAGQMVFGSSGLATGQPGAVNMSIAGPFTLTGTTSVK